MKNTAAILLAAALALAACNKDEVIETQAKTAPVITLDSETAIYTVKTGRELTVNPTYKNAEGALFEWTVDGRIAGREPSLTFTAEQEGKVFVTLRVSNRYGTDEEELRIDVVALEVPEISLPGSEEGFKILIGRELALSPQVAQTSIPTAYTWSLDGRDVSHDKDYTFVAAEKGEHTLRFETSNEDGSDAVQFTVAACTADELPFEWTFPQTRYHLSLGRTLRLLPLDIANDFDVTYAWTVAGPGGSDAEPVQEGADPLLAFTPEAQGLYTVTVTAKSAYIGEVSQELTVEVCPPEGTYKRPAGTDSDPKGVQVYELVAAPGQFVRQITSGTSMQDACAAAAKVFTAGTGYISLGGFGGYVVVGFDHSIENRGGYDFAVSGNAFANSSEPGIVWVMQDENGDGLPNDTWYELKGSEYGKAETATDYAVTYYRPKTDGMPVDWKDNRGGSGTLDLNPHWPSWVDADRYTLRGTRLAARNSGGGTNWSNGSYDWGYADNYSKTDMLTHDSYNYFRISDAVTFDGKDANLHYIDFVKVQNGVNAQSGWLGELSTEVCGFLDYNLQQTK